MANYFPKVISFSPSAGEGVTITRTYNDSIVNASTVMVFMNGLAIPTFAAPVTESTVDAKFYATHSISSGSVVITIKAHQTYKSSKYNASTATSAQAFTTLDTITISYEYTV